MNEIYEGIEQCEFLERHLLYATRKIHCIVAHIVQTDIIKISGIVSAERELNQALGHLEEIKEILLLLQDKEAV